MTTRTTTKEDQQLQRQIEILSKRIEAMALETHEVSREFLQLQHTAATRKNPHSTDPSDKNKNFTTKRISTESEAFDNIKDHDFKIGDIVIITDIYLGRKGTKGSILSTSAKQVTIKDEQGKTYKRKHTNVKHG